MQNVSKKRVNQMSHNVSLRRSIFIYHLEHQMVQLYYGYILNSKIFPTTPDTPKSELKRRSYGPDKLDKENCRNRENSVTTKFFVATEKLCRDRENSVATKFFVATEETLSQQRKLYRDRKTMSRQNKLCHDKNAGKNQKRLKWIFWLILKPISP